MVELCLNGSGVADVDMDDRTPSARRPDRLCSACGSDDLVGIDLPGGRRDPEPQPLAHHLQPPSRQQRPQPVVAIDGPIITAATTPAKNSMFGWPLSVSLFRPHGHIRCTPSHCAFGAAEDELHRYDSGEHVDWRVQPSGLGHVIVPGIEAT